MSRTTTHTCVARPQAVCRLPARAMTLVELMVAMTITMLLVFALAQIFATMNATVTKQRATVEMSSRIRGVTLRIQQDIAGHTVPLLPWSRSSAGEGYFEVNEGRASDMDADDDGTVDVKLTAADSSRGDIDDVLKLTSRNPERPFVGYLLGTLAANAAGGYDFTYNPDLPPTPFTSQTAEIAWWTTWTYDDRNANGAWDLGEPVRATLHRRALLIRPDIAIVPASVANVPDDVFFSANDLSVHRALLPDGKTTVRVANTLADLSHRGNRFAHTKFRPDPTDTSSPPRLIPAFPHPLDRTLLTPKRSVNGPGPDGTLGTSDDTTYVPVGDDVMSVNVLAFDVQVYDPMAAVVTVPGETSALVPGDPGFVLGLANATAIGRGAYVDLGYATTKCAIAYQLNQPTGWWASRFWDAPNAKSQLNATGIAAQFATYDTWSWIYEKDGLNQNGNTLTDEGTNGLDDDGQNGVDDVLERETAPPYSEPLRSIQVRIRLIEPDSRNVRQETVVCDFVPE